MPSAKVLAIIALCGGAAAAGFLILPYLAPSPGRPNATANGSSVSGGGGPGPIPKGGQLILNNYLLWGGGDLVWASVSVRDSGGSWVTGLSLGDFNLSEELVSSTGQVIERQSVTFDSPGYYQFHGDGFWERSVTAEKLDIVFLVDMSGSMEEEMPAIHSELHKFLDRLESEHVDFRIAVVKYDFSTVGNSPAEHYDSWAFTMPFRGVMESEEIRRWLDNVQLCGGEWWLPGASYDQMMLASGFDFRDDARKVIVVITDTISLTVYGTWWYAVECTAATLPAVESLLKQKGIEVFYSQPGEKELKHLDGYYDAAINPKAWAGFDTLGTRISWPFEQEDIPIRSGPVVESQYFFAWRSRLKIPGDPREYRVNVSIMAPDPERYGEFMTTGFSYVPRQQTAKLVLTVCDEEGNPIDDDAKVWFMREMGDRKEQYYPYGGLRPKDGVIVVDRMPVGPHYVIVTASGNPAYSYEELRYQKICRIQVPEEGLNLTLRVETGDREMEFAKARGLLRELGNFTFPGDPFRAFVADAERWLDGLEANGVTWREMVAVKRFYVALSGYANLNEYAQHETEGAISNFREIVQSIVDIVEQVKAFQKARQDSFGEKLAGALLELAYDVITSGRFTAAKEAVEIGLDRLEQYASSQLLRDLVEEVLERIPDGPYKPLIAAMLNAYSGASFEDWESVLETAKGVLLMEAVDAARRQVAGELVENMIGALDLGSPLANALKGVVKEAILDLLEGGLDGFDRALEGFGLEVGNYVLEKGRDEVVAAVNEMFDKLIGQLPPSDFRDLALGLARDLIVQAIPRVQVGPGGSLRLNYGIDSDAVVDALVKHGFYHVVLKKHYVEKAASGLSATLSRARAYLPQGEEPDDWERGMRNDFHEYRGIVGSVQESAWRALRKQEDIKSWAETLERLGSILDDVVDALDVLATFYPPFHDEARAVHGLIAVLDGFQILPRAIELGLRVQCLDTFGEKTEALSRTAFGEG